jgi:hypothetical protein
MYVNPNVPSSSTTPEVRLDQRGPLAAHHALRCDMLHTPSGPRGSANTGIALYTLAIIRTTGFNAG